MKPQSLLIDPNKSKAKKSIWKIKETKNGFRYRLGHYKKMSAPHPFGVLYAPNESGRNVRSKSGIVLDFYDFGDRACLSVYKYSLFENKPFSKGNNKYWFIARNKKIIIKDGNTNGNTEYPKIISNRNSAICNVFDKKTGAKKKFIRLFKIWANRNGVHINRKYIKNLSFFLYTSSYPELEYLFDVLQTNDKQATIYNIPSPIISSLKGSKGLNQILNRIVGNHGKKIKYYLLKDQSNNDGIDKYFLKKLLFFKLFKGIVPFDKLMTIVEKNIKNQVPLVDTSSRFMSLIDFFAFRRFLKNYHYNTIYSWILNSDNSSKYSFWDTLNQYVKYEKDIIIPKTNNLIKIHDDISKQIRKLKLKPVSYEKTIEIYKDIQNLNVEGFRIEIPENNSKLLDWGSRMNNCIGGYSDWMITNPKNLLLGIYKEDELLYNISIQNRKIQQFKGKYNTEPDKVHLDIITNELIKKNVLVKND